MRQQGSGYIISIGSRLCTASNFALEGLSESLRFEAKPFGARVALIEPGDFRSQLAAPRRTTRTRKGGGTAEEKSRHEPSSIGLTGLDVKNACPARAGFATEGSPTLWAADSAAAFDISNLP